MNRDTFRSAYDKIALSDECKSEMKAKLLEQMSISDGADSFTDSSEYHRAQEIKITPRKKKPLKTALIAGSAAAAVGLAAGAGFILNRNPNELQQNISTPLEAPSAEAQTTEPQNFEYLLENEYKSTRYASGTLTYQEFKESREPHSQQEYLVAQEDREDFLKGHYLYLPMLGMFDRLATHIDSLREQNRLAGYEAYDIEATISQLPLGEELWLSDVYCSDKGAAVTYLSEDGAKQVNLSVSNDPDEFLPITLPGGGYLAPVGEYQSSFVSCEYAQLGHYQFIDPETFGLAAGSARVGEDEYFSAVFAIDWFEYGRKYYRLDAKNITEEQFSGCLSKAANVNIHDHYGYYADDGVNALPEREEWDSDSPTVPEAVREETHWGTLVINPVSNKYPDWNGGFSYNVQYTESNNLPEEYSYTLKDLEDYSGIDVEKSLPEEFTDRKISYSAKYDELPDHPMKGKGWGANSEMLPGDDPEQFEMSRDLIGGIYDDNGVEQYDSSFYMTDKIDYFSEKTRIGALYSVECSSDDESRIIRVDVFDDWEMFQSNTSALFARLPAEKTTGFAWEEDRSLYVGGDVLNGNEYYIGGFKIGDGKFVVVQSQNTGLDSFAEVLAKLFNNKNP